VRQYAINLARAASQLLNAIAGGASDETLCARLYRLDRRGSRAGHALRRSVDWIARRLFRQTCHCSRSYVARFQRALKLLSER
jgi:hypothetical protein